MSREIKFRVWDTKNKKFLEFVPPQEGWIDAEEWDDPDEMDVLIYPDNIANTFNGRLIWLQFTGLKDRNNIDIYEGDYVVGNDGYPVDEQIDYRKGVVGFKNGCYTCGDYGLFSIANRSIKGNIYENPEFIK